MCGRFTQHLTGRRIHELYRMPKSAQPLHLQPRYNGAPTQDFAVCRLDEDGRRALATLRWGLVPSWAKDRRRGARLVNARAETVHGHAVVRRCLPCTPVSGASQWVVRMATDRARQTALFPGSRGRITRVVRGAVGMLGQGRRRPCVLHDHHHGGLSGAGRHPPSTAGDCRPRPVGRLARSVIADAPPLRSAA